MNKQNIISRRIEKLGNSVQLIDGEWKSVLFKAVVSPLWRKKSTSFENSYTEIGSGASQYYHYIDGANHDITVLSDNAILKCGESCFEFKHCDKVAVDDEVLYFNGILRKLEGECFDEN